MSLRKVTRSALAVTMLIGAIATSSKALVFADSATTGNQTTATGTQSSTAISGTGSNGNQTASSGSQTNSSGTQAESSDSTQNAVDIAAQANITSITVTGQADEMFHKLENKYRPRGNSLSNPNKWAGFCRQGGRQITLKLAATSNISSVSLSFQQNSKSGAAWPDKMQVLVSTDAKTWYVLQQGQSVSTNEDVETITATAQAPIAAKYLRIIFPVQRWVFAGQLHIWAVNGASAAPPSTSTYDPGAADLAKGLLTPDQVDGIHHILLVYTGDNGSQGHWSADDFTPMIDYINQWGYPQGTLFDTMLFLPYSDAGDTVTGWTQYLDDLFGANGELANLNTAMQAAVQKSSSNNPNNTTENVIIAFPYPNPDQSNFGSIVSGQPSLDFNPNDANVGQDGSIQNREIAVQWYFDQVIQRWKQANYSNLHLSGFYWNNETIPLNGNDEPVIQYAHSLALANHLRLFWIPFYGANGVNTWDEDFDAAILQANYYTKDSASPSRVQSAVASANQEGLGLELELDASALNSVENASRYLAELESFSNDLPLNAKPVEALYAGSKALVNAYSSNVPWIRNIYDETAQWLQSH
ncbi:MAG: DUF4855 domain-containing protein [Alicyclobacillus sp.]|nr:DUF4855 domain-containing protein [Alicyclobacillus sp.]